MPTSYNYCPNCGKAVEAVSHSYCPQCGHLLANPSPYTPNPYIPGPYWPNRRWREIAYDTTWL